jgi:hypothetical protein
MLEDTGSMHGVYVNGRKITTRTEIVASDKIAFGSKVTRAEGDYLSCDQAFNFSEYPFLTPLPATHDGVSLTVGKIDRDGANFTNSVDLTDDSTMVPSASYSETVPQTSYRVPDYDTDSSKETTVNTTFKKATPMPHIDLDDGPVPSPARSQIPAYSDDEDDEYSYDYGTDPEAELDSDHEGNEDSENSDEFDDDEQSVHDSDRNGSSCCSDAVWEQDDTQRDEADLEIDDPLESHEEPQAAPIYVNNTELVQPKETYPRVEEKGKGKAREATGMMSISYMLEPTDRWNTSSVTLTPSVGMPPTSGPRDAELPLIPQRNDTEVVQEKVMESQSVPPEGQQIDAEHDYLTDLGLMQAITASQSRADEMPAQSNSPAGSKRKRHVEDDGHEDVPATSVDRKLLKLKFKQHILSEFFKSRTQTAPRPIKRAKRSTARFALGAVAGAIGGVATVVGVLMTPACEELLSSWPIA